MFIISERCGLAMLLSMNTFGLIAVIIFVKNATFCCQFFYESSLCAHHGLSTSKSYISFLLDKLSSRSIVNVRLNIALGVYVMSNPPSGRSSVAVLWVASLLFVQVTMKIVEAMLMAHRLAVLSYFRAGCRHLTVFLTGLLFSWIACNFLLRYRTTWIVLDYWKLHRGQWRGCLLDNVRLVCEVGSFRYENITTVCSSYTPGICCRGSPERSQVNIGDDQEVSVANTDEASQKNPYLPVLVQRMERAEPIEPELGELKRA